MKPTLLFFRAWPENLEEIPPLASSLQSFESALISIRHWRFPDALVQLVSAWESCIKAALRIPQLSITKSDHMPHECLTLQKILIRDFSDFPVAQQETLPNFPL
jgi:hypothetical protein